MKVVIVSDLCSLRMGGEAAISYQYFKLFRKLGVDAYLIAHARNRDELSSAFAADAGRIFYVEDGFSHRALFAIGEWLPPELRRATTGLISRTVTQLLQKRIARRLVASHQIQIVYQPTPVSPAEPSLLWGLGAPVVMGPMNGGIEHPPNFRARVHPADRAVVTTARWLGIPLNRIFPGKRRAKLLLAANPRTGKLVHFYTGRPAKRLVENGVDFSRFGSTDVVRPTDPDRPVRFAFCGRLVDWKGVDLLLTAWSHLSTDGARELLIIGDGPERKSLERQAARLGLQSSVRFAGWLQPAECAREVAASAVLVHPSLHDCGGAVVLEAMACGLPVIAADWGGPADYLDPSCGILVPVHQREDFIQLLSDAIGRLHHDAELRRQLGEAGRQKVIKQFCWDAKAAHMLKLFDQVLRLEPRNAKTAPHHGYAVDACPSDAPMAEGV